MWSNKYGWITRKPGPGNAPNILVFCCIRFPPIRDGTDHRDHVI
jgi:hypothetical protein